MSTQKTGGATPAGRGMQPYVSYAQELDALFQIGIAITAGLTVEQVLQSILDECRRVLPVETLYVALYDAPSHSYEIPLFFEAGQYYAVERQECRAARSLTCDVIAQRSALYIPDTHDPDAMGSHRAVPVGRAPTRTYLGVPMIFRERVIGVLSIQSLQVDAYAPSVIQLLQTIAMQAAVAVENARLHEAAQQEIAERAQIEAQLRIAVAKYSALFDTAPVGISIADEEGRIVESNREAETILGVSHAEQLARTIDGPEWQIVRPDGTPMPASEYASVRAAVEQRRIDGVEMGIVHDDGSICWISANAVPIPLDGHGVAIAYTDITERRRAEDALRASEARYRMLADNVHDAVWVRNLQGDLVYASPSIARLWGYTSGELPSHSRETGATSLEAMDAARQRAERMMRAVSENRPVPHERFDLTVQRGAGTALLLDVLQSPLIDAAGKVTGFLFVGRDVTEARALTAKIHSLNATLEQRVAERTAELSAALDQLLLADRMKDELLAAMSHELRTPLTGVLGAADALALNVGGPLSDYQTRQVQTISENGGRLLRMVNDLLRYASLSAGKTRLLHERCSLAEVSAAVMYRVRDAAARKQQQITLNIVPPGLIIESDAEALIHVLEALLDNAVKFTPVNGHIALDIVAESADFVRLSVTDDGIGMDTETRERIFLPFVQGDGSLSRSYAGVGLGLAYVARMVEALGGTVGVESEPGQGSRFTIVLPTRPPAP